MADRISLSEEEKNSLEQLDVFLEVHKDLMDFTGTSDSYSTPLAGASKTVVTESTMEKHHSSTFDGFEDTGRLVAIATMLQINFCLTRIS